MFYEIPPFRWHRARQHAGFSLIEILVVMAIIGLLTALVAPALVGFKGGANLSAAASEIGDILEQARAYAMGNNTHTFVGFAEYDASKPSTGTQVAGVGRVVVAIIASNDGTAQYDVINQSWVASTKTASALAAIAKPRTFEHIHLSDYTPKPGDEVPPMTGTGSMLRPVYTTNYGVGSSAFISSTSFNYPLTGTARYSFTKVIDFDAKGVARVINFNATTPDAIPATIEIDLQSTHGNTTPAKPSDTSPLNYVAIQCDGITGITRVFQ